MPTWTWQRMLRLLTEFLLLVSLPFVVLVLCIVTPSWGKAIDLWLGGQPFDSVSWAAADTWPPTRWGNSPRAYMLDDLLTTHDFAGWSRADVEALLGKPRSEQPAWQNENWTHVWYLVTSPLDTLQFTYDEKGIVQHHGADLEY